MSLMTPAELTAILREEFPDFDADAYAIEEVTASTLRMRLLVDKRHLRPGGTVLGPALMQLADLAAYFCVMAPIAPAVQAVTTSLTIHFLRRPRMADVVAHARALRPGEAARRDRRHHVHRRRGGAGGAGDGVVRHPFKVSTSLAGLTPLATYGFRVSVTMSDGIPGEGSQVLPTHLVEHLPAVELRAVA